MIYPVQGNPKVTSGFGDRVHPVTGVIKFHNGIDLSVPVGTPVYSPESGTVDAWLTNEVGGKQMIVQHDNGMRTGYAHLDYRYKNEGDRVQRGEVIARSGDTGATTGAHLHFTMKDADGNFLDPVKYYSTAQKKNGNMAFILTGLGILTALYFWYDSTETKTK